MANVEMVGSAGRVLIQESAISRYLKKGARFLNKKDEEIYVAKQRDKQKKDEAVIEVKKEENAKAETKKIEKVKKKKKKAAGTDKEQD